MLVVDSACRTSDDERGMQKEQVGQRLIGGIGCGISSVSYRRQPFVLQHKRQEHNDTLERRLLPDVTDRTQGFDSAITAGRQRAVKQPAVEGRAATAPTGIFNQTRLPSSSWSRNRTRSCANDSGRSLLRSQWQPRDRSAGLLLTGQLNSTVRGRDEGFNFLAYQ